ncbi:MAG: AraC family transcriptional regulator [Verrucomicrobiales bacterium]
MKLQVPGKPIFGEMNRSSIWALDAPAALSGGELLIRLERDQVVFLFVVSGEMVLDSKALGDTKFAGGQVALVGTGASLVESRPQDASELIVVGLKRDLLSGMLESFRPGLREEVRETISFPSTEMRVAIPLPEAASGRLIPAFRNPEVSGAALPFWYESQIREMIALVCFRPAPGTGEFFCSRQKRLAMDRVGKVKAILKSRLDEAIDLQRLAGEVGCSPFYLSRTFSATTGMTISQFIRKLRVEAAAELLLSGKFNVSEVALEVGYQSLSHFSKAFQQVKGCLPSKYDAA